MERQSAKDHNNSPPSNETEDAAAEEGTTTFPAPTPPSYSATLRVDISTGECGPVENLRFAGILSAHIPPGCDEKEIKALVEVKRSTEVSPYWNPEIIELQVRYKSGRTIRWIISNNIDDDSSNDHLIVGDGEDGLSPWAYPSEFDVPESDLPDSAMAFMYSYFKAPALPGKLLMDHSECRNTAANLWDRLDNSAQEKIRTWIQLLEKHFAIWPTPLNYPTANTKGSEGTMAYTVCAYRNLLSPSGVQAVLFSEAQQAFLRHWMVATTTLDSDEAYELFEEDSDFLWDELWEMNEGFKVAIYDATLQWVVSVVGKGCLEALQSQNSRYKRISMWLSLLTPKDVATILGPLKGKLTEKELLLSSSNPLQSNMRQYFISVARLADVILLFHLCQDKDSMEHPRYCNWNMEQLRAVMKGFFISAIGVRETWRRARLWADSATNPDLSPLEFLWQNRKPRLRITYHRGRATHVSAPNF